MAPAALLSGPLPSLANLVMGRGAFADDRPDEFTLGQLLVIVSCGGFAGFLVPVGAIIAAVSAALVLERCALGTLTGRDHIAPPAPANRYFSRYQYRLISCKYMGGADCVTSHGSQYPLDLVFKYFSCRLGGSHADIALESGGFYAEPGNVGRKAFQRWLVYAWGKLSGYQRPGMAGYYLLSYRTCETMAFDTAVVLRGIGCVVLAGPPRAMAR